MSQQIALLGFLAYIGLLFAVELRRRTGTSPALWTVVVWVALIGSRPVSTWINFGGEVGGVAEAYDEGDALERLAYFVLIGVGLVTLSQRRLRIERVIKANTWLVVFFLYWGLSILWADLPFLALKRWVKDIGNVVMVLVVLTEGNPIEAIRAVFVRCSCLLIPLSVLFIRYYPKLGRTYHLWTGEMMYTGVTTHKNSLGTLVLVCGLFFMWDLLARFRDRTKPRDWIGIASDVSLMTLLLWLLVTANSATTLVSAVLGVIVFAALKPRAMRRNVRYLELGVFGAFVVIWLVEAVTQATILPSLDISGFAAMLGRDPTLTTRTEVWPMLLGKSESILFGAGFNSFWSGERLEQIYSQLHILQAHNGYLETYLNGGLFAVVLLIALVLSAIKNINRELVRGSDYARIRLAFVVTAVTYNFAEASFNKMSIVWFALLLVVMQYPRTSTLKSRSDSTSRPIPPAVGFESTMTPTRVSQPVNEARARSSR